MASYVSMSAEARAEFDALQRDIKSVSPAFGAWTTERAASDAQATLRRARMRLPRLLAAMGRQA